MGGRGRRCGWLIAQSWVSPVPPSRDSVRVSSSRASACIGGCVGLVDAVFADDVHGADDFAGSAAGATARRAAAGPSAAWAWMVSTPMRSANSQMRETSVRWVTSTLERNTGALAARFWACSTSMSSSLRCVVPTISPIAFAPALTAAVKSSLVLMPQIFTRTRGFMARALGADVEKERLSGQCVEQVGVDVGAGLDPWFFDGVDCEACSPELAENGR